MNLTETGPKFDKETEPEQVGKFTFKLEIRYQGVTLSR